MTPPKLILIALFILAAFAFLPASGQSSDEESTLVGDWRGESVCQVRESACRDEDSSYHVEKLAGKPHWVSLRADKIVQGKPVTMGTIDCLYDAGKHTLTCEYPRGGLQFTVAGSKMQGTMTMPDKTVWRKIDLKKVE